MPTRKPSAKPAKKTAPKRPSRANPEFQEKPARLKGRRHPFLDGWPKDQWCEAAVGKVRSYPKTLEAFEKLRDRSREKWAVMRASGIKISRLGVRDGQAGRKEGVHHMRAFAKHKAERIFAYLKKEDMLLEPDNILANNALLYCITLHEDIEVDAKTRLQAARTVLEWTKAKPATKIDASVRKAEDFLTILAQDALEITED